MCEAEEEEGRTTKSRLRSICSRRLSIRKNRIGKWHGGWTARRGEKIEAEGIRCVDREVAHLKEERR